MTENGSKNRTGFFHRKKIMLVMNMQITQSKAGINKASHLKHIQFRNEPNVLWRKLSYQKRMLFALQIYRQSNHVLFRNKIIPLL